MGKWEKPYIETGKRVRQVREELSGNRFPQHIPDEKKQKKTVSQESFAAILDEPIDTIRSCEQGRRPLSKKIAEKISKIAETPTPIEWLMGEQDFRNVEEMEMAESQRRMAEARERIAAAEGRLDKQKRDHASYYASVLVLEDAAQRMGLSFQTFIDPQIENESILKYCSSVSEPARAQYMAFSLHSEGNELDEKLECASLYKIQKRLARYAEFLIKEAIEEGEEYSGER